MGLGRSQQDHQAIVIRNTEETPEIVWGNSSDKEGGVKQMSPNKLLHYLSDAGMEAYGEEGLRQAIISFTQFGVQDNIGRFPFHWGDWKLQ